MSLADREASQLQSRLRSSVIAQTLGLAVSSLGGLAVVKIITLHFGKEVFGRYATATGFVLTFALMTDLGVSAATVRALAREPERAQTLVANNLGLRMTVSVLFIPLIFGLSYLFYPNAPHTLRITIVLVACFLPIDAVRQVLGAYYSAQVRNILTSFVTGLQQVVLCGLVALVAVFGTESLLGAAFASASAVGLIVIGSVARRTISLRPQFDLRAWRQVIASSLTVGLVQVTAFMYQRLDGVLVSVIAGSTQAGVYALAYLVVFALSSLPGFVMGPLLPGMSRMSLREAGNVASEALWKTCLLTAGLSVAIIVAAPDIVDILAGPGFSGAVTPMRILIGSNILAGCTTTLGYLSISIDGQGSILRAQLICLALNVGLNCAVIPLFGVTGAALVTITTEILLVAGIWRILARGFHVRLKILSNVIPALIPAVIAVALVLWIFGTRVTTNALGDGVIKGSTGLAIFGVLAAAVAFVRQRRRGSTYSHVPKHTV